MIHVRDNVSARGAGNYHDISGLECPPDSEPPVVEMPSEDSGPVPGAGIGEVEVEGMEAPSKRARMMTPLTMALRRDASMLDAGQSSASSMFPPAVSVEAQDIPVPGGEAEDEDLEVLLADGDHWLIDHGRQKLVRVHVSEMRGSFIPKELELPVDVEHVSKRCRLVAFDREGRKVVHEYEWKGGDSSPPAMKGPWTGTTEFELAHGWSWKKHELECYEVAAKKGRKELTEAEVGPDRRVGLDAAKTKEWNKLVSSGAIVVHEGRQALKLRASMEKKRFATAMQLIASHGWSLNIADVEGGVPGVAEGSLIEAVKTVYGLAVGSGEFLGKQLKQQADGSITISQKSYAQQQKGLEISPERRREKHELITEEEADPILVRGVRYSNNVSTRQQSLILSR
ncbi:unnamed protein product [Symbiodinium necroappetens]|uniref:Uncharacterized protein n=1 Tax=Symbiodinium necroappetens TaxID=1628268 RepID=A0A813A121_9DINO|nr:unnamed protein product [Symbiodinium necroappetens]